MKWRTILMLAAEALMADNDEDEIGMKRPIRREVLRLGDASLDAYFYRLDQTLTAAEDPVTATAHAASLSVNLTRALIQRGYAPGEISFLAWLKAKSGVPLANILYYKEHGTGWPDMPDRLGLNLQDLRRDFALADEGANVLRFPRSAKD